MKPLSAYTSSPTHCNKGSRHILRTWVGADCRAFSSKIIPSLDNSHFIVHAFRAVINDIFCCIRQAHCWTYTQHNAASEAWNVLENGNYSSW
jgi:hypothetical protein